MNEILHQSTRKWTFRPTEKETLNTKKIMAGEVGEVLNVDSIKGFIKQNNITNNI